MEDMHLILRWHGEKDPISLRQYAQIPNLYGIVTSLYHLPLGQVWDRAEVLRLKEQIEAHGLKFELVDSFRIHEDIKRGYASRDALIENYRKNIRMLAECGIRIICYNFMPVFDWTRTDLAHVLPDGSDCLSFEEEKVRAVDPERGIELPGWGTNHTPAELQALLHSYRGIGEEELWDNCRYFLRAVLPVAEECGVKLALHPDDPPRPIFGLPRIAHSQEDFDKILKLHDSPANTVCLCTGSLGSNPENDVPAIIRHFGKMNRIGAMHVRNVKYLGYHHFREAAHLSSAGDLDMYAIMKAIYDTCPNTYVRPDHGRMIWDEQGRPGYGLYDRALGATYLNGLWEAIEKQ